MSIHVGTLDALIRTQNSAMGNPRWVLIVGGHRYVTQSDAQVGHEITQQWLGKVVSITCDEKGRVTHVQVLPGQAAEGR